MTAAARRSLTCQRGFTLAELLVAAAVVGVIMAGVFVVQRGGQQAYLFGSNRVETQQNARVALDLMTRELRTSTAVTAIGSATDVTFQWKDETHATHTIRYWLSGTTLNRTYDGTTTALIGGVQSLAMTYYKVYNPSTGLHVQTSVPAEVKAIRIALHTKTEETVTSGAAADARARMESDVTLRSSL